MWNDSLYNIAKQYISYIEIVQNPSCPDQLAGLTKKCQAWQNRLIMKFKSEGIAFKDRQHLIRIAYRIIKDEL